MAKQCAICGKTAVFGNKLTRRGMARRKGGAGQKITGIAKRRFMPNLQPAKTTINGRLQRVLACAKCIKAGLKK